MRNKRAARKRVSSFDFEPEPEAEPEAEPSTSNNHQLAKIDHVPPRVPKKRKLEVAVAAPDIHSIDEIASQAENLIIQKAQWNTKQKINLYSKTRVIDIINEKLTAKQKDMFRKGPFGHFLDFKITKFPSQLIHHLILRQCPQGKKNELWFNIEGTIAKFGIKDFALITGLNCNNYPFIFEKKLPESTTKRKFFKKAKSVQRVTLNDVFRANKGGSDEDIVKLAKLYCLESLLIPKKLENNIDPNHLKMVDNQELFDNYPWGRLSYEMTMEYIKRSIRSQEAEAYGIGGFPYAVIVWAYETIPTLIKKNFAKRIGNGIPRILNWEADQQPSFREVTDRVFDYLELEVRQILPSKEEMEQPFMAPFAKEKKKEVNGVEEEKDQSDYEDVILMPTPITEVRSVRRTENQGRLHEDQVIKSLMCKVERMEKTQLEMKKDMEEMYTMLLEIHSKVADQPSYFAGRYSNKDLGNLEENNDKVVDDRNKKMGENDGEKNDEQKDDNEKIVGEHNDTVVEDVNKQMEHQENDKNSEHEDDAGKELDRDDRVIEDVNEKMENEDSENKAELKEDTGKEDEDHNAEVIEGVNETMGNENIEKNAEPKDGTRNEDEKHDDKVVEERNKKKKNNIDSKKHGERKDSGRDGEKGNKKSMKAGIRK